MADIHNSINENRRMNYSSEKRREVYERTRVEVLQKLKEDRAPCPLCGLDFRRLYIRKHLVTRHRLTEVPDNLDDLVCRPSN